MELGVQTRLYLPPWKKLIHLDTFLDNMGIRVDLDVRSAQGLHRRWKALPFIYGRQRMLKSAPIVYTRFPQMSPWLARAGIAHHLEIHDTDQLKHSSLLKLIVELHAQAVF